MLKINGFDLDVDYAEELEPYADKFYRMRIRGNKLQACSPFRYENNPSFAVNLDNGLWVDSGASDESMRKGNFISLLAFLREESYTETFEYLFDKYTHFLDNMDTVKLDLNLQLESPEVAVIGQDKYEGIVGIPTEYLLNRGIDEKTQRYFQTGKGSKSDCVALPWHDKHGRIINIKYRSMRGKEFWFTRDGQPIKNHLYGLFAIKEQKVKTVWAVESEIDCLYLWSCGIPAIAFGGGSMSDKQRDLILSSGIETLIIATDNDQVGHRFAGVLCDEFAGILELRRFIFPSGKKDVNEISKHEIISGETLPMVVNFLRK